MSNSSEARNTLRTKLLGGSHKAQRKEVELFGSQVELKQPSFRSVLSAREEESSEVRSAKMIVDYTVVPGTDELVFEEGDIQIILEWPFAEDLIEMNSAIASLTGINIDEAATELKADPLDEPSQSTPES